MQESDGHEHHIRDSQYWWSRASGVRKSHGDPPESRAAPSYDLVAGASKIRHKSSHKRANCGIQGEYLLRSVQTQRQEDVPEVS